MKTNKKIISILLICILLFSTMNISNVYANYSVSLTESKTVEVGNSVTITASVNAGAWNLALSGNGTTEGLVGQTTVAGSASASKSITFTPTSARTYTFTLTGDITDYDTDENINVNKSCTITVKEKTVVQSNPTPSTGNEGSSGAGGQSQTPTEQNKNEVIPQDSPQTQEPKETKSQNNHLSSLVINDGVRNLDLKQTRTEQVGFNRDVEDYTVVFDESYDFNNLEVLKVDATKEDSKAKISGTGNYTINEGDNTIEVKCTAEDGKVKTYRIKVTKPIVINKSELKLDSLEISYMNEDEKVPIILDNLFNSETYEYSANIDADINSIFVKLSTAKVKDKDIIVKVNGKEVSRDLEGNLNEEEIELEDGKNTIRITLISPVDEDVQTDYVLTIDREAAMPVSTEEVSENKIFGGNMNPFIILGVIAGIIILLLIILAVLLIINHRRKKKAEKEPYINEEKIEDLNQVYTNRLDGKEKMEEQNNLEESLEKNDENKETSLKQSDKIDESSEDIKIDEDKILKEAEYELLSDEERKAKLEQLEKELKDKNKRK